MKDPRKDEIMKMLEEHKVLKAGALAEHFQVSMETIRRDLSELEKKKLIRRVHGGAVLYTEYSAEPEYSYRTIANYEEKLLIGKRAAQMVNDGDTIIIDLGTTALEFAKCLKGKKGITVFTNSLKIANELMPQEEITVYLLGGKIRHGEGTISGCWAEEMIQGFFADKLFLGVGAFSVEHGVMDYHVEETNLRRYYLKQAKTVIALADYSKFGIKALNLVCRTEQLDYIVTDEKTDKKTLKEVRDLGVQVITA